MDSLERFLPGIIESMRMDIERSGGNEVFWSGTAGPDGRICSVKVGSRGNSDSVVVNRGVAQQGQVLIHNHPNGILYPSAADQGIAASAAENSMGFYIVDNDVSRVYAVVEPVKAREIKNIDADSAAAFLSSDGPLAKRFKNYEERPSQIELLRNVVQAFNASKIGVFEAGTGVGKSYAYLIPAILWSDANKERVVISTGTINLQQQLFEKDIPAALSITGKNIKSVLVKGRQNYICKRRLSECLADRDLFSEDNEILEKINSWAQTSPSGSRSEMLFVPPDSVWTRVNSESDGCMGMRCQYHEECFVMKVRKEASDAGILVVNHHLLFADIESRMNGAGYEDAAVLPPYKRIVFDEAHGIEDSATSFLSETVTRFKLMKQVGLLYRTRRGSLTGLLVQLSALSMSEIHAEDVGSAAESVKNAVLLLDQAALAAMETETSERVCSATVRSLDGVMRCMEDLRQSLVTLVSLAREIEDGIDDDDKDVPCVWEAKTVLRRLDLLSGLCADFCSWQEHPGQVFWMQKMKIPPRIPGEDFIEYVQFVQTPLDIAPLMNSGVFEPLSTVVCTSATLRTGGNFSYWLSRTGISLSAPERVVKKNFESPFPYADNVLFAVTKDAPFVYESGFQNYVERTLPLLIQAAGGRTLVLFTSYDSLRYAYQSSCRELSRAGITVFKQGDDDRFRLLERFKADRESVLFATDSFWEGVDVPGDSLSQVVIVKLPFSVPNDPVFAARSESIENRGGSSFMELSVPQAVIKFRQGFGRLVRRGDDRGAVVVLDRRIVEKSYGRMFTSGVPLTKRMYADSQEIALAVKEMLES